MKKIFLVCAAGALLTACGQFREWDAPFVGYNVSNDDVTVVVNDGKETLIPANRSLGFTVTLLVPTPRWGTTSPSSTVDRPVQVSVAFRNLRTGELTRPVLCQAGAKVVTHVWYETYGARCTFSY